MYALYCPVRDRSERSPDHRGEIERAGLRSAAAFKGISASLFRSQACFELRDEPMQIIGLRFDRRTAARHHDLGPLALLV